MRDIDAAAGLIAERLLLVIENTSVANIWQHVSIDFSDRAMTVIPHLDSARGGIVVGHMLHSDGVREATSYALDKDLTAAMRQHAIFLRDFVAQLPEDIKREFSLDYLLRDLDSDSPLIYLLAQAEDKLSMILNALHNIPPAPIVDCPRRKKLQQRYKDLNLLYSKLRAYYLHVAQDTQKYTHRWSEHPNSTVFAYQNEEFKWSDEEDPARLVYHYRDVSVPCEILDENPLRRNYIIRTDGGRHSLRHHKDNFHYFRY